MKGVTHYIAGVAAASCFPGAVEEAVRGNPLPMLAGGFFGLMPDALDFKGARFLARHDLEIVPDPLEPDMQMVADGVALGLDRARQTKKPIRIRLHPIQLGADAWQAYQVTFSPDGGIETALGAVRTTGGRPLSEASGETGAARVKAGLVIGYEATVEMTILDGTMLGFVPLADGRIRIEFIPWHRAWSHSLVLAAAAGLLVAPAAGGLTGLTAFAGWAAHALADQLGFLGSALFWPLSRKRLPGFQFTRSMDSLANLTLVWLSVLLIFWNLARFGLPPVPVNGARLLVAGGLLPLGILYLLRKHMAGAADPD
jgi:membrane-bound metal-dependent hydrolase YbcI (DUF457 family)